MGGRFIKPMSSDCVFVISFTNLVYQSNQVEAPTVRGKVDFYHNLVIINGS